MKTNRTSVRNAAGFGLIARKGPTPIMLPLKGVECGFSVQGGMVEVTLKQIFCQENPKPLDCDYLFPLPADAAVYGCAADINGRVITAQVRERAEAVKLAAEKKAEGRRVVLMESERENLFTLTLNNLQPQDLIVVTLKYVQPLRVLADMPSVEIPFCPGIRYILGNPLLRSNRGKGTVDDTDQVPDASRLSPVRIDELHPDAAYVEIRGTVESGFIDAASLMSPSHPIICRPEAGRVKIRLSGQDDVPDRDFVLRWQEAIPETVTANVWRHDRGGEHYALVEIRAPKAAKGTAAPMDFYFLVDRSGSMQGVKWAKAVEAVQSCVATLGENDRAMITLFGTHRADFAERPLSPGQLLADPNFQNLAQLPLDGGTEMGPALRHVLEAATRHSASRSKSLILITDAQVGNETGILKIMEPATDFPMHCFGIDHAVNDALLLALARQQNGTFSSLKPEDDVAGLVTKLGQTIRHPVLTELKLAGNWELALAAIPPLYAGQTHYFSARSANGEGLGLTAQNGDGQRQAIAVGSGQAVGAAPYLHWCKNRIQHCLARNNPAEAVALSVKSNLICPLTAFSTWDESEKVAVAEHAIVQPVMAPAGAVAAYAGITRGGSAGAIGARSSHLMARKMGRFAESEGDGNTDLSALSPPPGFMEAPNRPVEELEREFHSPVLGVIPPNTGRLIDTGTAVKEAEAYRMLRTRLLAARKDGQAKIIALTSASEGEGKSTTVINLAMVCAQAGQRVVVVDVSHKSVLAAWLMLDNAPGLTNYLHEQNTLAEIVQATSVPNFDFIAAGGVLGGALDPLKLLAGLIQKMGGQEAEKKAAQMKRMIAELRLRYDIILFDSPVIFKAEEAAKLVGEADMIVQVIQNLQLPLPVLLRARQVIDKAGGNFVGIVLNKHVVGGVP